MRYFITLLYNGNILHHIFRYFDEYDYVINQILLSDKDFLHNLCMNTVEQYGNGLRIIIRHLHINTIRDNIILKNICLVAVKQNHEAIKYVPYDLKYLFI